MKIKIGDLYLITSNSKNVVVNQKYIKKSEEADANSFGYKAVGYFKSLEHACNYMLEQEIKISEAENLSELVKVIHDTKALIVKAIKDMELK